MTRTPTTEEMQLINAFWYKLPIVLRRRWWKETDYGKAHADSTIVDDVLAWIADNIKQDKTS